MNRIVTYNKMCISCGACVFASNGKVHLNESKSDGMYLPHIVSDLKDEEIYNIKKICPANGYKINAIADDLFGNKCKCDYRIGRFHNLYVVKSRSEKILKKASSGGIMTSLSIFLLEKNIVQGIVSTIFTYNKGEIFPMTKIFTSPNELLMTQGSKYMPVPALIAIDDVLKFEGQVAFIGTPCQIASLRLLQESNQILKEKIKYILGNFCGGFKDRRELFRFISIAKMKNEKIVHFQYRGDGQPGRLLIVSENGNSWERAYTRYSGLTGYMKYYRCRVCIDATAELADISCGDAWLPKYLNNGGNWSAIIVRNPDIQNYLFQMQSESLIKLEDLSLDELVFSQKQNITSKKERYQGRINFLRKIRHPIPVYDGGWNKDKKTSFFFEAKVYYSQLFKYYMEQIGLYSFLRIIAKQFTLK